MAKPIGARIHRMRLGLGWYDPEDAARELGIRRDQLTDDIRPLIEHRSRSLTGARTARSVGYAYPREEIHTLRAIMDTLGCRALQAARHLHAIRRLRDAELIEVILAAAQSLDDAPRHRRRRQ